MKYYRFQNEAPKIGEIVHCWTNEQEFKDFVKMMKAQDPLFIRMKFWEVLGQFIKSDEGDAIVRVASVKQIDNLYINKPSLLPTPWELNPQDSVIWLGKWKTQLPNKTACLDTCNKIAGYIASKAHAIQVFNESDIKLDLADIAIVVKKIDNSLSNKIPIVVGVYWRSKEDHKANDGLADHFIVIVGAGTENGKKYYRFADPGTEYGQKGIHPENRFFVADGKLIAKVSNLSGTINKKYVISQIRPK